MNDKMKKPIRRFPEHSDMTPPKTYLKNTVSLCKKEKHIHFNPYQWQYFTIESLEDNNTFSILCASEQTANSQTILVSLDNGNTWEEKTASSGGTEIFTLNANQKALVKSDTWKPNANNNYENTIRCRFIANNAYKIYGNILSLLYGDNFLGKSTLNNIARTFQYLFYKSTNLKDASNLVLNATTLTAYCYYNMFAGCTNLVNTPELPATSMGDTSCGRMFEGCTSLTTTAKLPATALAIDCYYYMFNGCTSLITAPELPATTLTTGCYQNMFSNCTSLTTASELPATTLANSCYYSMYYGTNILPDCTNIDFTSETVVQSGALKGLFSGTKITDEYLENILPKDENNNIILPVINLSGNCYEHMFAECRLITKAPELPATTITGGCYKEMFYACSNLLTAPSTLPALTLYGGCYQGMFEECRSLTAAPELPATTIASSCYIDMFRYCTSLKTGPTILPALTLYDNCYRRMFRFCKNLENAPILPASTLVTYCYHHMFDGANKINHVKCLANSGFETEYCITNWLLNTSSTGTFVKAQGVEWPSGVSGIPTGWTVEEETV